jgi:hypothetical protein
MFRQVIAIISGVIVPWKLLRQGLYCGCIWITIRPVWLVVGGCSCMMHGQQNIKFCPHVFQTINHPNMRYYIAYPVEKVALNKPRLTSDWRLVCISHTTFKSVKLFSTQDKDSLVCSSLSNSLFYINNSTLREVNRNCADRYSLMLNHMERWLIIMGNRYTNPRTKLLWHRTTCNGLCGCCFIYSANSQHEFGVLVVR